MDLTITVSTFSVEPNSLVLRLCVGIDEGKENGNPIDSQVVILQGPTCFTRLFINSTMLIQKFYGIYDIKIQRKTKETSIQSIDQTERTHSYISSNFQKMKFSAQKI